MKIIFNRWQARKALPTKGWTSATGIFYKSANCYASPKDGVGEMDRVFFSLSYFCLDTKVPKNQGKKNAVRSAKQLSGSIKTRHFLLLA